jgi:hypothetical protein
LLGFDDFWFLPVSLANGVVVSDEDFDFLKSNLILTSCLSDLRFLVVSLELPLLPKI